MTKTFSAKIRADAKNREYLWLTHVAYNQAVCLAMRHMKWMERGKNGPMARRVGENWAERLRVVYDDMMRRARAPLKTQGGGETGPRSEEVSSQRRARRGGREAQLGRGERARGWSRYAFCWMEPLTGASANREWGENQRINPLVRQILRQARGKLALFDRWSAWPLEKAHGFHRAVFNGAARRILNDEQNRRIQEQRLKEAQQDFEMWRRGLQDQEKWDGLERVRQEFEAYEQGRARETGAKSPVRIDPEMIRGWSGDRKRKGLVEGLREGAPEGGEAAVALVKEWQRQHPKECGDASFLEWAARRPHLWREADCVGLMAQRNGLQRRIERFSRSTQMTWPDPLEGPAWFEFAQSPGPSYDQKSLRLGREGSVKLAVLAPRETGPAVLEPEGVPEEIRPILAAQKQPALDLRSVRSQWVEYEFAADRRLAKRLRWAGAGEECKCELGGAGRPARRVRRRGGGAEQSFEPHYEYDRSLPDWQGGRPARAEPRWASARVGALRLRFLSGWPYLDITVDIGGDQDIEKLPRKPTAEGASALEQRKVRPSQVRDGYVTMAVDLGLRHVACATVCEWKGQRPELRAVRFFDARGLGLGAIQAHQAERGRLQRRSSARPGRQKGHVARGESFAPRLQQHVQKMKEDRKKKAGQMVAYAARRGVKCIIFENLTGFRPQQEFTRWVNRNLMMWNRRELVSWVSQQARPEGIDVYEWARGAHTSQVCWRCGKVGARFVVVSEHRAGSRSGERLGLKPRMRQVVRLGPLFGCANTGCAGAKDGRRLYVCDADFNAAMNLHLSGTWQFDAPQFGKGEAARAKWAEREAQVQRALNQEFGQGDVPPGWPEERRQKYWRPQAAHQ
jgi:IS605 OrfB family transposase